jgi:putative copper export protein
MSDQSLWLAIHYLHLLAMAFFVGGQLVLVAAVLPVERRFDDRTRLRAIARRFGIGSLLALVVLAATGTAMAIQGGRWDDPTLQLKLGVVALVVALAALHLYRPRVHQLSAAILLASLVVVWLGLELAH